MRGDRTATNTNGEMLTVGQENRLAKNNCRHKKRMRR